MATLTKIADTMRGVNSNIEGLRAATAGLSISDKKALLEILSKDVEAAADVASAPKKRLAAVSAAATSKDPRTAGAYKTAVTMLKRLGTALDSIAASGDISALEKKARELKWSPEHRTQLKLCLNIIGATS